MSLTIPNSEYYISDDDLSRAELLGIDQRSALELLKMFDKFKVKEIVCQSGARIYQDPESYSITFRL